jgi:alpha-mannosidase
VSLRIESARSEELFVGTSDAPRQVARVALAGVAGQVRVTLEFEAGRGAADEITVIPDLDTGQVVAEVPFDTEAPPGTVLAARAVATVEDGGQVQEPFDVTVAETGWTMHMVSHFHYDPVWWNTQATYTATYDIRDEPGVPRRGYKNPGWPGFSLVRVHLDLARRDPEYRFVLAEVDYLKPYWDAVPADRAVLRELIRAGRIELMGGTYNEPNTNLTSAECTIRNFVYGIGFQRDVLGADPATAWQLDAFGHDPQFAGMAADAGISSSAWARGPFHQWGPMVRSWGDVERRGPRDATVMQFPSEFMWLSPSGRGVLTHYMPNHYGAGWDMESSANLDEACERAYRLFQGLRPVALTRNVLLPVGGDFNPPNKWLMDVHRGWRERYVWPRFVCALPKDFFAAVRAEMAGRGVTAPPQTRDMNPVYTGKDVSYVDTKQGNRRAEQLLMEAETWATLARLLVGRRYDDVAFDRAWRLLLFGAHHDAITGSESDQVYIDLLTGWREAHDLARAARDGATSALAGAVAADGLVLFNSLNVDRSDMVSVPFEGLLPVDEKGGTLPHVVESGQLWFRAPEVPGIGYRTVPLVAGDPAGWESDDGCGIANQHYRVTVDPARGGCVTSLIEMATGEELIEPGRVGNELLVYEEYPQHPDFGEGPWHLVPKGPPVDTSGPHQAVVRRQVSPAGQRLTVTGGVAGIRYTQTLTLWHGLDRLDCVTTIHEYADSDRLIRVRWPCPVPGGLPVSEVGNAVIGRGFGLIDVDSSQAPWTLDNPAYNWFGLSSTARVRVSDRDGRAIGDRAIGIAELVFADWQAAGNLGEKLATALARRGVTSTTSVAEGPRYGNLDVDSNLPDIRIAVGSHGFVHEIFAESDYATELAEQLTVTGRARLLVPAGKPLPEVWQPGGDLTSPDLLPVLVIAGMDSDELAGEVAALVADLDDGIVEVRQSIVDDAVTEPLRDRTSVLFNRGLPGFAVDPGGALHLSLLRSCTGWPSGIWIDPPKRTAPDGSAFQLMHWSHRFEYAFASGPGDWRAQRIVPRAAGYNRPLHPVRVTADEPATGRDTVPRLPATARLLEVGPADQVMVNAVKAAGNPRARGRDRDADPADGLTVRCYETTGSPARVRIAGPVPLTRGARADLLEQPLEPVTEVAGGIEADLAGAGVLTVTGVPVDPAPGLAGEPAREPAQPVHSRYWLHNKGPAPLGNQPVGVFLTPERLASSGEPVGMTVTVSSELVDTPVTTRVEFVAPDGWSVDPPDREVRLAPGGFSIFDATLRPAADPAPGNHFVAARIVHDGQSCQDVTTVHVPGGPTGGLEVVLPVEVVTVAAGDRTILPVRLTNTSRSEIRGELQAVSPYGSWDFVNPAAQGFSVPPGDTGEAGIELAPPPHTAPGTWWLMAKVNWYGRIAYSPAIAVRVIRP